jgi:CHASE3 domain sensor protein
MANSKAALDKLGARSGGGLLLGIAAVLLSFAIGGAVAYRNTRTLSDDAALVTHTHEVLTALDDVLSFMKDAETGQRGFVITGDQRYLEPYNLSLRQINDRLDLIDDLVADNPEQLAQLPELRASISEKLQELGESINVRRDQGFEAAQAVVVADRGREVMDKIRSRVEDMERVERELRTERIREMNRAYRTAVTSGFITTLIGVALAAVVGLLIRQAMLRRAREEWLQAGQIELNKVMGGDVNYEQLGQNILKFFAEYLDANSAALFVRDSHGLRRVAAYGVPANGGARQEDIPTFGRARRLPDVRVGAGAEQPAPSRGRAGCSQRANQRGHGIWIP